MVELTEIKDVEVLRNIKIFQEYLLVLQYFSRMLIIISVKDTPGFWLDTDIHQRFLQLGMKVDLRKKHWHSYIAVIKNREILFERIGKKNEPISTEINLSNGDKLYVASKPFLVGNVANIKINNREYAVNKRGVNIVVYDPEHQYVIDSVAFDTHVYDFSCSRKLNNSLLSFMQSTQKLLNYNNAHIHLDLMAYHTNHQFLEARAREKLRTGKKLRVFFIVSYAAKFGMDSIYKAMESGQIFQPYIFVVHIKDQFFTQYLEYWKEVQETYELFQEKGYRTILGYDDQMRPLGLEHFSPDIIFQTNPNLSWNSFYQVLSMNYNYLSCFVPYGIWSCNLFDYHYENSNINTSWKVFCDTFFYYSQAVSKTSHKGFNYVLSGYPKLDVYAKNVFKKQQKRKKVIIAPHWSIRTSPNMAVFHLYYQQFLNLLNEFPMVDFYFKPHPDLRYRLQVLQRENLNVAMTPEDYDHYRARWESYENGFNVPDGDYMNYFLESDVLITDCGSFIEEYLPSEKPCIYILNPERNRPTDLATHFNALAEKILQTYYLCNSWEEAHRYFVDVVIQGNDPKQQERKNVAKREFINLGNSGRFIVEYLTSILSD